MQGNEKAAAILADLPAVRRRRLGNSSSADVKTVLIPLNEEPPTTQEKELKQPEAVLVGSPQSRDLTIAKALQKW